MRWWAVGVLMRFVWRSLSWVREWMCWDRGRCVFGVWLGVRVVFFMTILTISMSTVCLTQFGQKVD